jgi:two-component system OmpR family response regulator
MQEPREGEHVRLLIVEDEPATRGLLERGLKEELFSVEAVANAESAELRASADIYDAIVLDVMLPDHDGFTLCRRLRTRGIDTPILFLSGRHGLADRVNGLDGGADDYLAKPFAFEELLARLRAITRRGRSRQLNAVLSYGPIQLDGPSRLVTVDKSPVLLSRTEFRLLQYLLLHADQTVSRDELARHVWDATDDNSGSNVIDVFISYLRKRLGSAGSLIRTVRRVGYSLTGARPSA